MEWTDIFSGPAFEPVKSRELHLGKDCLLNYPIDVLIRLACYYNTSVDYLLGLTDERTPYPRAKNRDF